MSIIGVALEPDVLYLHEAEIFGGVLTSLTKMGYQLISL